MCLWTLFSSEFWPWTFLFGVRVRAGSAQEKSVFQPLKNILVPISLIPTYFLSSWCALLSVSLSKPCHRQDCGLYTNCNKTKHKHLNISHLKMDSISGLAGKRKTSMLDQKPITQRPHRHAKLHGLTSIQWWAESPSQNLKKSENVSVKGRQLHYLLWRIF